MKVMNGVPLPVPPLLVAVDQYFEQNLDVLANDVNDYGGEELVHGVWETLRGGIRSRNLNFELDAVADRVKQALNRRADLVKILDDRFQDELKRARQGGEHHYIVVAIEALWVETRADLLKTKILISDDALLRNLGHRLNARLSLLRKVDHHFKAKLEDLIQLVSNDGVSNPAEVVDALRVKLLAEIADGTLMFPVRDVRKIVEGRLVRKKLLARAVDAYFSTNLPELIQRAEAHLAHDPPGVIKTLCSRLLANIQNGQFTCRNPDVCAADVDGWINSELDLIRATETYFVDNQNRLHQLVTSNGRPVAVPDTALEAWRETIVGNHQREFQRFIATGALVGPVANVTATIEAKLARVGNLVNALGAYYETHRESLVRIAKAKMAPKDLAEDVVSDLYVEMLLEIESGRWSCEAEEIPKHVNARLWRRIMDHHRRRQRNVLREQPLTAAHDESEEPTRPNAVEVVAFRGWEYGGPGRHPILRDEVRAALVHTLAILQDERRAIAMYLFAFGDISVSAIAALFDVHPRTVMHWREAFESEVNICVNQWNQNNYHPGN